MMVCTYSSIVLLLWLPWDPCGVLLLLRYSSSCYSAGSSSWWCCSSAINKYVCATISGCVLRVLLLIASTWCEYLLLIVLQIEREHLFFSLLSSLPLCVLSTVCLNTVYPLVRYLVCMLLAHILWYSLTVVTWMATTTDASCCSVPLRASLL